jgi:hypothetical protein
MRRIEVERAPGEEVLKSHSFERRLGVQREIDPLHIDIEVLLELLHARSREITPRADKVCENLEDGGI